ncbi:MAG TPA: helicase-related protein [Terriglobales bacterium]|nr:helicase-related protein [Terriglobales bacterium]
MPGDFASRIRKLRSMYGLTQQALADHLHVSFATVNRWENGQTRPSRALWRQILRFEAIGPNTATPVSLPESTIMQAPLEFSPRTMPDFLASPQVVRTVAEGERLAHGYLFNSAFAAEISLIEPLPHQRIAVYEHLLPQPRLRFLLADDAGAGKTIMAGLYIREILSRRVARRILIVPPAGLVGNWEKELRVLFGLRFRVISGSDARIGNPFIGQESDLLIVSVDTLAGERMFGRLKESSVVPYDLVIFDEAHKLSADREPDLRIRKTDRYRLAEAFAGVRTGDSRWELPWTSQHLLLLTATPHMGKDFPYFCLWRLLEPEVLPSLEAFNRYPTEERQRHFIRRTKEEMVRFDGTPIYPQRICDTHSYELTKGVLSEQSLYDETTQYIRGFYNRARILNRSAARLAMSIFQRRLASSTYALMRSFERRLLKLDELISDLREGKISPDQLLAFQRKLDELPDVWDEQTADEEGTEDGQEQGEVIEDRAMAGVIAVSLPELQAERKQVERLVEMSKSLYETGEESKFEKLRELLRSPKFRDEKVIVFTEHRDTMDFLVRRLEGLGFAGKIARIHGGMDYRERELQVEFFRKPIAEGGAAYLVATDAAGEGINLQFCWLMVNYDIPWNPARLEQRMGRIHRYGQKHDPVVILNLVAGKTREGRVLKTLLEKLEKIRRELRSDKVFDVIGRLFEGISLRDYMENALLTEQAAVEGERQIESRLTEQQVRAIQEREKRLYGDGGDVKGRLADLAVVMEIEELRRLLPGYVRGFVEKASPLLSLEIEGDINSTFSLRPLKPGALEPLWPALETYSSEQREHLTVYRPADSSSKAFLHPGEPVFDSLRSYVTSRFGPEALRGAVFVDPTAGAPYLFHLASAEIIRKENPNLPQLANREILEERLIGLKQQEDGTLEICPVEHLLLLKGASSRVKEVTKFATQASQLCEQAKNYLIERVAQPLADERRQVLLGSLPKREEFIRRGYDHQEAELALVRSRLAEKAQSGDAHARGELTKIKERQRALSARRDESLAALRAEPDLIQPGDLSFIVHALVVPSTDPEDKKRYDAAIEATAVKVSWAHEEAHNASVKDVSTPELARQAGLTERPGFDLLSQRPPKEERAIEVKGRAAIGDVELTDNEWAKACNLRGRYWLYVVYNCAGPNPRLLRVQDPFGKLLAKEKGGVIISEQEIFGAAEADQ